MKAPNVRSGTSSNIVKFLTKMAEVQQQRAKHASARTKRHAARQAHREAGSTANTEREDRERDNTASAEREGRERQHSNNKQPKERSKQDC